MNKAQTTRIMLKKSIIRLITACLSLTAIHTAVAQQTCHIKGTIGSDSLRFEKKRIETIYLSGFDEYDRPIVLDSARIEGGRFEFKRQLRADEPILMHLLTGFDNGYVSVFLEPGTVEVNIRSAAYPSGASVRGTENNDLYMQYRSFSEKCSQVQQEQLHAWRKERGDKWLDSPEGERERLRFGAEALMQCTAERIEFLVRHPRSPLTPLMFEREVNYMLDKNYSEKLLNTLSPELEQHPYYISFSNAVKAQDLKVGGELPNITLPLLDGGKELLSKYRGKYVLLDFWASWCAPCIKELPYLKELHKEFGQSDKFALISFSLDNKEKDWKKAIETKGIKLPGWVHASDLLGWSSPTAKMCDVTAVPKMILLDPEGKVISFTLRGEEMLRRVRQVMSGDTYYLSTPDDKD